MALAGSAIKSIQTGLIYRNPKPHVRSVHAYFPSVALMANGELLCTFTLGQAFESPDCHTQLARSVAGGEDWHLIGPIYPGTAQHDRLTSDSSRITAMPDGEVVALMNRADRSDHPDTGLTNPEDLGFVPTEFLLLRSVDQGHTWSQPAPHCAAPRRPGFRAVQSHYALAGRPLASAHLYLAWLGWFLSQRHDDGGFCFPRSGQDLAALPGGDAGPGATRDFLGVQDRRAGGDTGPSVGRSMGLRSVSRQGSAQPVRHQPRWWPNLVRAQVHGPAGPDDDCFCPAGWACPVHISPNGPARSLGKSLAPRGGYMGERRQRALVGRGRLWPHRHL